MASLPLNVVQKKAINQLKAKIKANEYVFEKLDCLLCGSKNFELLSEKSRYGIMMSVVICKDCGLVQTNPLMTETSLHEFYNSEYREIDQGLQSPNEGFFLRQFNHGRNIYKYIERITRKPIKNKFIVEIGTGAGGILKFFKEKGNKVFGLDIDSEYIEFGKEQGLNLEIGTLNQLSALDRKPDLVICSHVLEHLRDPVRELQKIRTYMHNSSILYAEVPGIKFLHFSYEQNLVRYLHDAHTFHFTLNSLINCMKKAGFQFITGNEVINSLFKIGSIEDDYRNEFDSTIQFLQELEKIRNNPFDVNRIKFKIARIIIPLLNLTRTTHIAESIFSKHRIKNFQ